MQPEPQTEHVWLQRLIGEWEYEHDVPASDDKPAQKVTGTESVRTLGGLWVVCEGRGEMPCEDKTIPATTIMTLGYDPARKRFVGTFIGSMMTNLWVYDGELDASGQALNLHAAGPSFTNEPETANYKDVIEFKNDDHRTLTSLIQDKDGAWKLFMTAHYRRKK